METLQYFHFIRPAWLLGIIPVLVLWYLVRPKRDAGATIEGVIAPHLAEALRVGAAVHRRFYAIDGVAAVGIALALAVAGPTWSRVPNPLIAETAPLVVALKVTKSMETPDLAPSRLERARFKILDLVSTRAGARTALVAYAGTAHRVSPLTEDPNILRPLLEGLTPKVMPEDGSNAAAALDMAVEILGQAETPGAILFALDDLNPADVSGLNAERDPPRPPLVFLVTAPDSVALPQLEQVNDATVVRLAPDEADIEAIERRVRSAHAAALAADDRLQWDDRGWWLAWPAALLVALWFRRGWTMRWVLALMALGLTSTPGTARADGWIDWFLTPDQQGRMAYENKEFSRSADLFEDPEWKGYMLYRSGRYDEAAEHFGRFDSPEAAFNQGMAQMHNRQYRPAIRSFEAALVRRPDYPAAARNLEIAKAVLEYVESTREASDTGEDTGVGADDVVFDNEDARGAETVIEAPKEDAAPLTAEQWMQTIDTDMGDFLRSRFLLDRARGDG